LPGVAVTVARPRSLLCQARPCARYPIPAVPAATLSLKTQQGYIPTIKDLAAFIGRSTMNGLLNSRRLMFSALRAKPKPYHIVAREVLCAAANVGGQWQRWVMKRLCLRHSYVSYHQQRTCHQSGLQHVPAGLNRDSHRAADERFYRIDSPEG
jgi:hypothetical protein